MRVVDMIFNILRFNRRNWKAVVLCVVTATVFWCFNALNKTYTTNISFPLSIAYDDENFVPVGAMPQSVRLNVTGNGWELFKRNAGVRTEPLEIPLEHPAEVKKIVGSGLKFSFTNQLHGLEINHVLSDTIYLDLEPRAGRWIKLGVDSIVANLKQNYGLTSDIVITPDSTYIEGPKRIVDKVAAPLMLKIPHRNIDGDYAEDIAVAIPQQGRITLQPPSVAVRFNVEQLIAVTDSIRLVIENIPSTVLDVMTVGKVPAVLSVPASFRESSGFDSLRAVIDLSDFKGGDQKILPEVRGLPPYSAVVKIDSVTVSL